MYSSCCYIQEYMELEWIYNISEKKEDHCRCISVVDKTTGQLLFFLVARFSPPHPFYRTKMKATSPSFRSGRRL